MGGVQLLYANLFFLFLIIIFWYLMFFTNESGKSLGTNTMLQLYCLRVKNIDYLALGGNSMELHLRLISIETVYV